MFGIIPFYQATKDTGLTVKWWKTMEKWDDLLFVHLTALELELENLILQGLHFKFSQKLNN